MKYSSLLSLKPIRIEYLCQGSCISKLRQRPPLSGLAVLHSDRRCWGHALAVLAREPLWLRRSAAGELEGGAGHATVRDAEALEVPRRQRSLGDPGHHVGADDRVKIQPAVLVL